MFGVILPLYTDIAANCSELTTRFESSVVLPVKVLDARPASVRQPLPALSSHYKHACRNDPAPTHQSTLLLTKYAPQQNESDATNRSTRHQHISSTLGPQDPQLLFTPQRDHVLLHVFTAQLRPPASMVRTLPPGQARPNRCMRTADNPDMELPRGLPVSTVPRAKKDRHRRNRGKQRPANRCRNKSREAQERVFPSSTPSTAL